MVPRKKSASRDRHQYPHMIKTPARFKQREQNNHYGSGKKKPETPTFHRGSPKRSTKERNNQINEKDIQKRPKLLTNTEDIRKERIENPKKSREKAGND